MKVNIKNVCLAIKLHDGNIIFAYKAYPRGSDLFFQLGNLKWDCIHQSAVYEITVGVYES